jgi:hypothetical protein
VIAGCKAPGAKFDTRSRDLTLRGPVVVSGEPGEILLDADTVRWVAAERKLRAEGRVVLHRGASHLEARGIEADSDGSKLVFAGPVAARFSLPSGR